MAPIHRRADGTIELVGEDLANIPIGIMEDVEYESFTFTLQSGDSITMYTDGLNEAANPDGALFTMEAIEELVRAHQEPAQQRGERILESITTFMQGEQPDDDMCLVIFDRD